MANETKAIDSGPQIRSFPDLLRKEAVAALLALTVVCTLAALLDAPLQGPADLQAISTEHVKAPWIFVGIQQALRYAPPLVAGIILPIIALIALVLVAFVPRNRQAVGRWMFALTTLACVVLTVWGYFR